jgi:hypothetical protein
MLLMKRTHPDQVIGIARFAREDDEAFRRLLPRRSWHGTYDPWERMRTISYGCNGAKAGGS